MSYEKPPLSMADFYWWHRSVLAELRRCDGSYNEHGIADNTNSLKMDVKRWVDDLLTLGLVVETEAEFDYTACRWIALTDAGRDLLGKT